ncbi:YggT family protein [Alkalithermobacter paradoxus]|uniref:YGGT family protein n=1 Tax=Alkalithermobacter paradoxus TaxID=29349 RepID=A0A1V4IA60_9FIRM|nr:YGGT family protein [[Clostridium] thermoalcaliphilum]
MWVIIRSLGYFVQFIEWMIFIRVIMSWVRTNRYSAFHSFVYNMTEPIMSPIRELTFRYLKTGPIDLSPIIALFLIRFIYRVLVSVLLRVGI